MAKTNLSQLKNWFKNGLKPAQEHFWNWMDSFWHKDEFIPMDSIESLNETLGNKADVDHGHSDLAKKNASNLEPTDIDNWRELLFDNETGELTDQHIQLTDGYPDLAIPPESTQKDFNDVISSEVAALKEVDETPYMTINSPNAVTEDWSAKMTNYLEQIGIRFANNNQFAITWTGSFDLGWRLVFSNGKIELQEYHDVGMGQHDWVSIGNFINKINGEASADGDFILDESKVLTSKNFSDLLVDKDEPLTDLFDEIISRLGTLSSAVQNGIKTPTGLACNTNPNYPASTKGDSYKVTAAGKIGGASGPAVEVGDMIICTTDNGGGTHSSVGSNFFIVQTNLDQATESTVGYAKIATNAQTDTGTDDTTIVTPKKLKYHTDGLVHKTGAETIAGLKTFSSIPVLPASNPSTDNQAARKKYVDDTKTKTFTELTDTPANYTGSGGKLVAVNKNADALEFIEAPKANKKMQIGLSKRWEDLEADTMAYEFRVLTKMKIEEDPIIGVLEAPTGASIKVSIAKNGTFIGVSNPFLEIPAGNLYSTNTHDVKGVTFEKGDKMSFYINQVGSAVKGQGLDILLEYSE